MSLPAFFPTPFTLRKADAEAVRRPVLAKGPPTRVHADFATIPLVQDDGPAIARLRTGDVGALGDVYDRHSSSVRAFAVRFLGDSAAAEDLVHDVFVALPDAIARYRAEAGLRSFLVAMAANLSKNHVRAAARRRALATRASREPVRDAARPDESFDRAELATRLQRALDALSHEHRVAFVLCEIEERPSPEVAAMLGIPEATVRTRLFHGKKRLRQLLEDAR